MAKNSKWAAETASGYWSDDSSGVLADDLAAKLDESVGDLIEAIYADDFDIERVRSLAADFRKLPDAH